MQRPLILVPVIFVFVLSSLLFLTQIICKQEGSEKMLTILKKSSDISALFPKQADEITRLTDQAIEQVQRGLDEIIAIPYEKRTFENTARKLDWIVSRSNFSVLAGITEILQMVHPDQQIRDAAEQAYLRLEQFSIENLQNNVALYEAFKEYVDHSHNENLTSEERYFLQEAMRRFKKPFG